MSLLPSWVTRVAQKVTDYVQTFLAPSPEKIAVTSDHAAEKMLKAMEKVATKGTASGLHGLVRGAKKLIDYENGAFYMPRLVRVLADGLATPPAEETQASTTYRKHASLLMEQGCRTMVSESMSTYKAMAETGDDPLAAKNISENMQLVLEVSTNEKQLARALALSTGAIKMMRHHGDVAGTSAAVSGVRTALTEKAHPKARDLKSHFERFMTKLYKTVQRPRAEFNLQEEELTAAHHAAFAAARQRRAPLPEAEIKPPVSPRHQPSLKLVEKEMSFNVAETAAPAITRPPVEVFVPLADFKPYKETGPARVFDRVVHDEAIVVPDIAPRLHMTFEREARPATPKAAGAIHPHGRITDGGIYAEEFDNFDKTAVNAREFFVAEPLQKPASRAYTPEELKSLVGVFERCLDKPGYQRVAYEIKPLSSKVTAIQSVAVRDDEDLPVLHDAVLRPPQAAPKVAFG